MKLAFSTSDGGVTIIGAAAKSDLERAPGIQRPLTDAEYRAIVIGQNMAKGVIPANTPLIDLPNDWSAATHTPDNNRAYRAAWKLTGSAVDVDMVKARVIHMNYIRAARDKKLEETDKQLAALDGGPVPGPLKTQRQKLRDLPQTVDLSTATTVAALKAIWPVELQ